MLEDARRVLAVKLHPIIKDIINNPEEYDKRFFEVRMIHIIKNNKDFTAFNNSRPIAILAPLFKHMIGEFAVMF